MTLPSVPPTFVECGCCNHFHHVDLPGWIDCRDDAHRFTAEQLDEKYPAGWECIYADEIELLKHERRLPIRRATSKPTAGEPNA